MKARSGIKVLKRSSYIKLMLARLLNFIWYRTKIHFFRVLSNKISLALEIKAGDFTYVLTCITDLAEVLPSYEREIFKKLLQVAKCDSVFIDVGAHIGRFTFPMARLLSEGVVVAVEPNPYAFEALLKGIKLNKFRNVIAVNVALSDSDGTTTLYLKHITAASSILEFENSHSLVEVNTRSLDNLVKELSLPYVDIIKIDAEGAEILILKGAEETIKRFKPHILIEVRYYNLEAFKKFMATHDYTCEILRERNTDVMFYCYPS